MKRSENSVRKTILHVHQSQMAPSMAQRSLFQGGRGVAEITSSRHRWTVIYGRVSILILSDLCNF